ncbi:transcriptional activator of glycolytic enzymes-domain-containing protein [Scheffersomyces xylosifermentans]|uniref:transcriptional activator of glycolytic enzymes-domain-containing protein n=1 Tax=Scheffersomyces xylosifermentans TaxID=1304137 RepID=UPI00315C7F2B
MESEEISQNSKIDDSIAATSGLTRSGNNNSDNHNGLSGNYIQQSFDRINDSISKIENDKLAGLNHEIAYLRQLVDFQNAKIDKLANVITDFIENKNQDAMINSLQAVQAHVLEHDNEQVNDVQEQVQQQVDQLPTHDIAAHAVQLDTNMDPALHQVAVAAAAVQAQAQAQHQHQQPEKSRKKTYASNKRKLDHSADSNANVGQFVETRTGSGTSSSSSKKPKITVDFLHNPMSVKEIYDEFTKGFRGQPALCEMDAKYGKHEWRGDSRSKESKRYQRRKKLCDAIDRGMIKYGKAEDEIIRYIEEFRGEKSLTWVMNGNLPSDLLT